MLKVQPDLRDLMDTMNSMSSLPDDFDGKDKVNTWLVGKCCLIIIVLGQQE